VAIQFPDHEITAFSTEAGTIGFSSRRDTLFDGEISNSLRRIEVEGEYIWREDGWDDGNTRAEVSG
jgi:hypothetical protein